MAEVHCSALWRGAALADHCKEANSTPGKIINIAGAAAGPRGHFRLRPVSAGQVGGGDHCFPPTITKAAADALPLALVNLNRLSQNCEHPKPFAGKIYRP